MSQFEEFKNNEAWRRDLKRFLLIERNPNKIRDQNYRYMSQNLTDDIISVTKAYKTSNEIETFTTSSRDVNTMPDNIDKENKFKINNFKTKLCQINDDTLYKDCSTVSLQNCSIATFEAIEKMCDKEDDHLNKSLQESHDQKEFRKCFRNDTETKVDGLRNTNNILMKNSFKSDVTQLDEVEPPSKFWENTICQTSPIKAVGFNRPSTIIEEQTQAFDRSSNISSQTSFVTAHSKPLSSDASFNSNNSAKSISNLKYYSNVEDNQDILTNKREVCVLNSSSESDSSIIQISDENSELSGCAEDEGNSELSGCAEKDHSPKIVNNLNKQSHEVKTDVRGIQCLSGSKNDGILSFDSNNDSGMFETLEKESTKILPTRHTPKTYPKSQIAFDIKPIPKLDIFKKPEGLSLNYKARKDNFSHVMSPIGTYIKKSKNTPLMTTMKTNKGVIDALEILEKENNLYKQKAHNIPKFHKLPGVPAFSRTLPKKGYISSEFQHYIDKRQPITIPGGNKIKKYIENATLPAVFRHDGKIKIGGSSSRPEIPTSTVNASLANLSIASGDISVYTIKDAQKF